VTQQMIDEVVGSGECKSISDAILLADKARWPDDEGVFWVPENCYMATITEIQRLEALLYPDLATHPARSGVVSDEDVDAIGFALIKAGWRPPLGKGETSMRAALETFMENRK